MTLPRGVPPIPEKLFFRIGEVSEITGVQPYTLRHWEVEFPTLNPKKNDAGQRLYRRSDIEEVQEIQRLLHQEGYTTAGARRRLTAQQRPTRVSVVQRKAARPRPAPPLTPRRRAAAGLGAVRAALSLMERNDRELAVLLGPEDPGAKAGK